MLNIKTPYRDTYRREYDRVGDELLLLTSYGLRPEWTLLFRYLLLISKMLLHLIKD